MNISVEYFYMAVAAWTRSKNNIDFETLLYFLEIWELKEKIRFIFRSQNITCCTIVIKFQHLLCCIFTVNINNVVYFYSLGKTGFNIKWKTNFLQDHFLVQQINKMFAETFLNYIHRFGYFFQKKIQ